MCLIRLITLDTLEVVSRDERAPISPVSISVRLEAPRQMYLTHYHEEGFVHTVKRVRHFPQS